jgi:hypothetical protein
MRKNITRIVLMFLITSQLFVACQATSAGLTQTPDAFTATVTLAATVPPTITATPTPALVSLDEPMKGVVYYPATWHADVRPETEWNLQNVFRSTGANWVRLHLECNQETATSTEVVCRSDATLLDDEYRQIVKMAHDAGFRVMAEHLITIDNDPRGYWHGDIGKYMSQETWDLWWASYSKMILMYAALAEETGVEYLVIGSELDQTYMYEQDWRNLIRQVREVYHGGVTVAYDTELPIQQTQFWDALDSIGVHPYFLDLPYVEDPSVEQLVEEFRPHVQMLQELSIKWDKPVILTEVGIWSVETFSQNTNNAYSNDEMDLQDQANTFQAIYELFWGQPWVQGIFPYAIFANTNFAEPWNIHNDFVRKPAGDVIRSFYGVPPLPTPTAVIYPSTAAEQVEIIYDDSLHAGWDFYPPDGTSTLADLEQTEIAKSGKALRVELYISWAIDFISQNYDYLKQFKWLDFDMYVDPSSLSKVSIVEVLLRDSTYFSAPFRVELAQSQFIEGGKLQPGTWQHVKIPMDVFGPLFGNYVDISISNYGAGDKPMVLYLDNIQLSK